MIGKWMLTQVNGHIVPTNEKMVYTIESATQGYLSASRMDYTEEQENWANHVLSEIELDGNKIYMYGSLNKTTSFVAELDIKSITESEMLTESKYVVYHNGDTLYASSGTAMWSIMYQSLAPSRDAFSNRSSGTLSMALRQIIML